MNSDPITRSDSSTGPPPRLTSSSMAGLLNTPPLRGAAAGRRATFGAILYPFLCRGLSRGCVSSIALVERVCTLSTWELSDSPPDSNQVGSAKASEVFVAKVFWPRVLPFSTG